MIFGFFMMAGYFLLHAAKDFRAMMLVAKDQSQALGHQSLINNKD
jgi:hypothetical protein